ncbi:GH36-type glycosyl hydrolase domain-containing protein [Tundrisphaera sp. TA3]|uniref:GH36-type glycosyl hydrolase domain-containing protein n=1 Tax=Tundrisphaera sp. TA3 TaxID=3435775 RepID=UPI003EC096E2
MTREIVSGMSPSFAATTEPAAAGASPIASPFIDPRGEAPIRAELYGLERLEALGRQLGEACVIAPGLKAGDLLLGRFTQNGQVLHRTQKRLGAEEGRPEGRGIDAEWFADNFHIISDVLREVRQDLPSGYYSELPKLAPEAVRGYPRVYALALALVAHTDSELDETRITRLLRAFQDVSALTIGELWAVPTMLRLVLIENLRRLAERMVRNWDEAGRAEAWAAQWLPPARGEEPSGSADGEAPPPATIPPLPRLSDPFVVRLVQVLRDRGPSAAPALKALEAELAKTGADTNALLRDEHRRQAANQVSVGNCLISLRLLSALDWNVFFEQNSPVEVLLREDPSGVYQRQDFATRDRYRRAVENLARRAGAEEAAVARRVVELARAGAAISPRQGHIGYYLIDRGLPALKREFGYRPTMAERRLDFARAHPRLLYFGSIGLLVAGFLAGLVALGLRHGEWGWGAAVLLVAALLIPIIDLAVGMVNHALTLVLPPTKLPRLDFRDGLPADCSTFVVMPSMLVRPESGAALLERLEIHHLANPDPSLRFALLTDFADAAEEHRPEDELYIRKALEGVKALNDRYAAGGPDKFFLFHRRRTWNPVQGKWMGWERKRGKLSEFNQLLRGHETNYVVRSGEIADLPRIQFVITLDADTQLPRESARRLIGTLAHPLNRPRFDPEQGRVVEGHGVLQPRVSYHLFAATRSRFAGLLAASAGIDPYANAVSDIYMDLFDLGTFTGKGIYDVDAFESAVGRAFPDNRILSHDLIEGNYARCGLVTDVELFDDFPPRYHAYALREHRWARGDWQLLPWLGRTVPTLDGPRRNPLPDVERWKVFDNLRRSLVPPALLALLILGWTVLPGSPWLWTAVALAVPALPVFQNIFGASFSAVKGHSFSPMFGLGHSLPPTIGQTLLWIAFLADQARRLTDAIARTLWRLFVSKKRMLEWETAAAAEQRLGTGIGQFFLNMWPSIAIAVAATALVAWARPSSLPAAAPVLIAWFLAPLVAYWISRPKRLAESPLTVPERVELRRIARKTWLFFETFVGDEDRWLPPDNFQEDSISSGGRIAHRTSPTNMGLLLLSNLSAYDFGYIGMRSLIERTEKTLDTFDKMEKHQGHFINWYNTQTLRVLPPAYVSTVDSGNLLGCLVALKQGLREELARPSFGTAIPEGLADALVVLLGELKPERTARNAEAFKEFDASARAVEVLLAERPADLLAWDDWLGRIDWAATALAARVRGMTGLAPAVLERGEAWARSLETQLRGHRADLAALAPWLAPVASLDAAADAARGRSADFDGAWRRLRADLIAPASVDAMALAVRELPGRVAELERIAGADAPSPLVGGLRAIADAAGRSVAGDLRDRGLRQIDRLDALATGMDFRFLYKPDRHLFSIGMNLALGRLDASCYDLMASEACLSSFLAIARGDAPRRHWFQLGRPFIEAAGRVGLMSWGGSMFEYLMPRLLLLPLRETLLAEAHETAVARQIEYGRQRGTPWGISESAYAAFNLDGDYHYQSYGTPGLGLKRDLAAELVLAPYATALAVAVRPRESLENFRKLAAEGAEGRYGYYEAVDFTRERVPKGKRSVVVRSYMAHHHGMSFVALGNALLDEPMPRRFHAEPMIRAAELLLQERVPRDVPIIDATEAGGEAEEPAAAEKAEREAIPLMSRRLGTAATPSPRTHLLSNSQYSVMVTNSGSGYSTCKGLDVSRWREDSTRDAWGSFIYIKDAASGATWSAGHHPTGRPADHYEAVFSSDKATFRRLDGEIETLTEITVSPESRAEIRRLTVTNHDTRPRELELTSYVELALISHGGDLAHPAFGKLFLETSWSPAAEALTCRRRPRSQDQEPIWAIHAVACDAPSIAATEFETDRARFLGRGRTPIAPEALDPGAKLSGTTGAVLDPIFSIRRRVRVEAGTSVQVAFTTAVAESRDEAATLADHYHDMSAVARAFELAWAQSQVEHRTRHWSAQDSHLFQRLASHVLFAGPTLRADPALIRANHRGQPGLWAYGISGDKPIVLATIAEFDEVPLAGQLLIAHNYLRVKGLDFDLVLLAGHPEGGGEELATHLLDLARTGDSRDRIDKPGGIFVRVASKVAADDRILLASYARVVLSGAQGTLTAQLDRIERVRPLPDLLAPAESPSRHAPSPAVRPDDLRFDNGIGGFSPDGRTYAITVATTARPDVARNGKVERVAPSRPILPPAPWINVVANPDFGFLVSEAGSGYTWAGNSQSNRLTPWSNDPVSDPPGEVLYLRDEATGAIWSPTPLPVPSDEPTTVRHGQGSTTFERRCQGLDHILTLHVPPDDPIKVIHLKVANPGLAARTISATFYAEWVLGGARDNAPMQVITEVDQETGALLARNPMNPDYAGRVAFLDVDRRPRTLTADRTEFLGRNGSVADPAALGRVELCGTVGTAIDPCGAIQAKLTIPAGGEEEITFWLGQADSAEEVRALLARHRGPGRAAATLAEAHAHWDRILGAVEVRTPNAAMDLMLNRWLAYQVASCRFWGRSATYQSGGAFGFRDQLQDSMALVYGAPAEARAHLVRSAARQFREGDVQHWWHPPAGKGVRTRITDDLVWLPYVACHYITVTGDHSVLDETAPFLIAPELRTGQEDEYSLPESTEERGTLYEHCCRALDRADRLGPHGLPLIGTGDWNDGMNHVGAQGRGESVWNAWFFIATLDRFAKIAEIRGDSSRASTCRERSEALRQAIETHAWDGDWYRRAYFDDGTPLGSASNQECRIDSLAQTWAAISGAGQPDRVRKGLDAVDSMLVREQDRVILLFTPPFDQGKQHPGYIQGYVPGVRENGGQYTHAATWVVLAAAMQGRGGRAVQLFDLINPVLHAADPAGVQRYKVEPFAVAADVYGREPHTGRGGWTWYTGSAAWLYRVGLESILGFHLAGDRLAIDPRIAPDWPGFEITYRRGPTTYRIAVENPDGVEVGVVSATLDGQPVDASAIPLADDGAEHAVRVVMGSAGDRPS